MKFYVACRRGGSTITNIYTEDMLDKMQSDAFTLYSFLQQEREFYEISEPTYAELYLIMQKKPYSTQLSTFSGEYYCESVSDHYRNFYCSSCDELIEEEVDKLHSNYCPNCGVKFKKG